MSAETEINIADRRPVSYTVLWLDGHPMNEACQVDPVRILLNFESFRGKFHVYEIAQLTEQETTEPTYVVRKQLLNSGSTGVVNEIRQAEKYIELKVDRRDVSHIYDAVHKLSVPTERTGLLGKDGTHYALQIGVRPCSTTIRWWSDSEPELKDVYKLRDAIVVTIKKIIRSNQDTAAT